jgi:hypothetical protein
MNDPFFSGGTQESGRKRKSVAKPTKPKSNDKVTAKPGARKPKRVELEDRETGEDLFDDEEEKYVVVFDCS